MRSEKQRAASSRNGIKAGTARKRSGFFSSELQSKRRLDQLSREEAMAQRLRDRGYKVWSPTIVCDRIAVKDGKVFFVEFKKSGQVLREFQQIVHDLVPAMYIVEFE